MNRNYVKRSEHFNKLSSLRTTQYHGSQASQLYMNTVQHSCRVIRMRLGDKKTTKEKHCLLSLA